MAVEFLWATKHAMYQKLEILRRKRISMLIGLKESFLACKWEFYRQEHNEKEDPMKLNFECLEIQK